MVKMGLLLRSFVPLGIKAKDKFAASNLTKQATIQCAALVGHLPTSVTAPLRTVTGTCEEAGVVVRREAFIPELSTPEHEAWLDLLLLGHPELGGILGDVTVRHPDAQRGPAYLHAAATTSGAAAANAEAEKTKRYPPSGGVVVRGLAHETWGRLGTLAEDLLATAAAAAAREDHRRGRVPPHRLRRWRAQLDADLQRAVAAQHLSAVHGLPGRSHGRTLPVDVPALQAKGAWPQPRALTIAQ